MTRSPSLTVFKTLECRPDSYQGWYQQGNALGQQGRFSEDLTCYDRALEYYPRDYLAWYKRGNILEALGRYEDAVTSY